MRPLARRAARLAVGFVAIGLSACGAPSDDRTPGPRDFDGFDFDVGATITVDDDGIDPERVTVASGELIEIVNAGERPHRLDGADAFDTGTMEPGDSTTVILVDPGTYPFVDDEDENNELRGVIVVE